jgi:hypothetical protein
MVRRVSKQGGIWHEPPYTEEESFELYRAMSYQGGGATILHGSLTSPTSMPPSPPKAPLPPAKK